MMGDIFYKREVARVQAWLKLGFERFLLPILGLKTHPIKHYYCEHLRRHKMPLREVLTDRKKWKIDVTQIDYRFAYRIDQATIGASRKMPKSSTHIEQHRRVFRWHLQETDSLAARKLGVPQAPINRLRKYVCISKPQTEVFRELLEQEYREENRRAQEKTLFRIDRL